MDRYSEEEEMLLDSLEYENEKYKDILRSIEFTTGRKVIKNIKRIKKFQILKILEDFYISKNIKKLGINCEKENEIDLGKRVISGKKIIVFSCITGNYDKIIEPNFKDYNCDYILFSDTTNIKTSIWKIREIPAWIKDKCKDNILINRYIKMHPHQIFTDYDYAIYIDGNIKLISDVNSFIPIVNQNTGLALHRHSRRSCIYDEATFCQIVGKGNKEKIVQQMKSYSEKRNA